MTTGVAAADRAAVPSLPRFMVPMLGIMAGIQTLDPMIATVALVRASKTLGFSAATLALASGRGSQSKRGRREECLRGKVEIEN